MSRGSRSSQSKRRSGGATSRPARTDAAVAEPIDIPPHLGFALTTHRSLILLSALSAALATLATEPINVWPVSFVCLVPWCVLIGAAHSAPRVYLYSYLMGMVFFLINLRWVVHATGWSLSWVFLIFCLYMATYYPLMACPIRHAIRRRRMPLAVIVPIVWTGNEMLRAVLFTGFPWFFLSHSLHGVVPLIQVADLVGAYGVSFIVAAVNGAVADAVIAWWARRQALLPGSNLRRARFSLAFALSLVLIALVYGQVRLRNVPYEPGPRIATLQADYISTLGDDPFSPEQKRATYIEMLDAARAQDPDLYLLPEVAWEMYLNPEYRQRDRLSWESFLFLRDFAIEQQAYIVVGAKAVERTPYDVLAQYRFYNSAFVFGPDGEEPGRYDKRHLVLFGETLPFRFGRFRFVYWWLNSLCPPAFSGPDGKFEWSAFPGDGWHVFTMQARSQGGRPYHFGVPICYEDTMPYIARAFVNGPGGEKQIDLLLNISHDGWFGRGQQQPQHLSTCVFRAVENRIPVVRAVGTGISGFIESSGRKHDMVWGEATANRPGNTGYTVSTVQIDPRHSVYSRYGDWFAWLCAIGWAVLYVDYFVVRARARAREALAGDAATDTEATATDADPENP